MKEIVINENWKLSADQYNFILTEEGMKFNPKTKDEQWGVIKVTYHRTIQQVFNQIMDRTMRDTILSSNLLELSNLAESVDKVKRLFEEFKDTTINRL